MPAPVQFRTTDRNRLRRASIASLFLFVVLAPFYQTGLVGRLAQKTIRWQKPGVGPGDIYSPWFGVRAALRGSDPYSPAITRQIQTAVYGQPLSPASRLDPMAFVYPAHMVFLLGPFAMLQWHTALLIFTLLSFPLIAATSWAWTQLCIPDHTRMELFLVLTLSVSSWPAVAACTGRQPTLLILALVAFALLLFRSGYDALPAVLLAFSTVKPHLVFLLVFWLLLVAIKHRRFRFLLVFIGTTALLLAGSLVLVPHWIPRWLLSANAYLNQSGKAPLLIALLGHRIGAAAIAVVLALLVHRLLKISTAQPPFQGFSGAVALLLAVTSLLIPANPWMLYNNLLLIPAALLLHRQRPPEKVPAFFRSVALFSLAASFAAAPISVGLSWIFGYSPFLALLPSVINFIAPLGVVPAVFGCDLASVRAPSGVSGWPSSSKCTAPSSAQA